LRRLSPDAALKFLTERAECSPPSSPTVETRTRTGLRLCCACQVVVTRGKTNLPLVTMLVPCHNWLFPDLRQPSRIAPGAAVGFETHRFRDAGEQPPARTMRGRPRRLPAPHRRRRPKPGPREARSRLPVSRHQLVEPCVLCVEPFLDERNVRRWHEPYQSRAGTIREALVNDPPDTPDGMTRRGRNLRHSEEPRNVHTRSFLCSRNLNRGM
jgi:hypothetical protein